MLYVDNLHPMVYVSVGRKNFQVSPDYALEYWKNDISFFRFHSNINAFLLDKLTVKADMHPFKLLLKLH